MLIENARVDRDILRDKVAIVTGAGRGIGRETARALARLGARVVIAEISDSGLDVERMIRSEGGQAIFIKTDIADPASVERLRQQVITTFGHADILVNNAVAFVFKSVLEHSLEEWESVMAVNLRGWFLAVQAFLPTMLERRTGVIITMESAEGMPYMGSYLATKAGLRSLSSSLAQELPDDGGVSVVGFGPGMVDTPAIHQAIRALAPRYGLTPEEFVKQSAPGGQLSSAEVCATGVVGCILNAHAFHGQDVDFVNGLARIGLDACGQPLKAEAVAEMVEPPATREPAVPTGSAIEHAIALNQRMEDLVRTNIKEYGELSMFQRPFVKRMFSQGTGMAVEEWLASAEVMTRYLRGVAEGKAVRDQARLTTYIAQVRRMSAFITKQESDARGWIKDPEKLRISLEALRERKAMAEELAAVLGNL